MYYFCHGWLIVGVRQKVVQPFLYSYNSILNYVRKINSILINSNYN
nr:MAG TPA: hypothetical protein [Bacteriophage sp.]